MTDRGTTAGDQLPEEGDRWHLEDRREFLRRSLEDADREHEAGDLADEDYLLLRRRDEELLAGVEAALAALGFVDGDGATGPATTGPAPRAGRRPGLVPLVVDEAEEDGRRRPRRRRLWLALGGTAAVVAGVVLLVVHVTSPRLPGETATGGVRLNHSQLVEDQLTQAATLVQDNKLVTALQEYKEILSETPHQPQALAEWGWLTWQAADTAGNLTVAAEGRSAVAESVKVEPSLYAGHLYLGTILLTQKQPAAAVTQYKAFLADHPPKEWVTKGADYIREAYTAVHEPVPAQVKAAAGGS